MKFVVMLVLFAPLVLACVVPEDGMVIDSSMQFCNDVYYFDRGISVNGDNVNIDCNHAVLKSWSGGTGVSVLHSSNVTILDCRIVNYDVGLYAFNSSKVFFNDNILVKNRIGSKFVNLSDSATFNHDVSLSVAFEISDSRNNVLSLTNKQLHGSYCSVNFCNQPRSTVSLFVAPKTPVSRMKTWLFDQLSGKNSDFHSWFFSSLV